MRKNKTITCDNCGTEHDQGQRCPMCSAEPEQNRKRPQNCKCDNGHEQAGTCCMPCWQAGFRTVADSDQKPEQPRQFSYDGFGINGDDQYKSRLATLTAAGQASGVGPLLAAAPELLAALKQALTVIENEYPAKQHGEYHVPEIRAAIAKAVQS